MTFEVGQTVVRRDVRRGGRIAAVESARVLSDGPEGLLTWTGVGSQTMWRTTLEGESVRYRSVAERDVTATMLSPREWERAGVLMLTLPDPGNSVWWFFEPDGRFRGWYVNLESPLRRWARGFDIHDYALDIWVEPDRSWSWKDEDEFAERTGHPEYWTHAEADEIRAAGEKFVGLIESGAAPFDGRYIDNVPDPGWEPSRLPPKWDTPSRED
ncbi:uncharacterized protein DUF402 [Stackebrandtia endophytica]|uniref:Uncharacterized protein DUF402 n=1 Tax=Stackebrandtia endophytica TaxID=1496996 RepID=A0A543B198_9ACTN|nr:DUF402 domain-containing protein [Stackebrandtia endophytica]TQL78589.1 uncharacterized protein DUF402 [Stackebrandtia endophytica]